ncbi:MAG TPA: spondin domain-containing protein [Pyrinomonadaceae bacterium]|nr:spondin domain-containing protein [Pyrinomonadaceae bacterium]
MKYRKLLIGLSMLGAALSAQFLVASAMHFGKGQPTKFTVRIENISTADGQIAADGTKWPFALSPGMWVLHNKRSPLFSEGKKASSGLEAQAEDGNPAGLVSALEMMHHASSMHGIFNTPVGTKGPGPIGPGGTYEFSFNASPGTKLSMALMFGQSNDLFYAPETNGIALFDLKDMPLGGDVTSQITLWDAGTEVNQELGVGPDQAPRQKAPNTGTAENGVVEHAKRVVFYTKTAELFRVTITPESGM